MAELPKKIDRSGPLAGVAIAACFVAAYGFSNQNAFLMWVLPAGLIGPAAIWAYWPHRPME
jgi:hypothetical protein